uniref:F-box domain-containing protein n=1 Tax=Glossina austeni TaxID=7395 RepID=A0A1A9UV46_GLOAU
MLCEVGNYNGITPYEMWRKIFGYLSHASLQQVKLVCKEWYELAHAPALKRKSMLVISKSNLNDIDEILERRKDFSDCLTYESVEVRNEARNHLLYDLEKDDLPRLVKVFRNLGARVLNLKVYNFLIFSLIQDHLPMLKELDLYGAKEKNGWHAVVDVQENQMSLRFDLGCYLPVVRHNKDGKWNNTLPIAIQIYLYLVFRFKRKLTFVGLSYWHTDDRKPEWHRQDSSFTCSFNSKRTFRTNGKLRSNITSPLEVGAVIGTSLKPHLSNLDYER